MSHINSEVSQSKLARDPVAAGGNEGDACKETPALLGRVDKDSDVRLDLSNSVLYEDTCHVETATKHSQVLLATTLVNILIDGKVVTGRALLDTGSQSNSVTERFADKLNVQKYKTNHVVNGIGKTCVRLNNQINIILSSRNSNFKMEITCLIIPQITSNVPKVSFNKAIINIPDWVSLADPQFNVSNEIDLLLGSDLFWAILRDEQYRLGDNMPVLQNTAFGYVLAGRLLIKKVSDNLLSNDSCNFLCTSDDQINHNISKFWVIEEVHIMKTQPNVIQRGVLLLIYHLRIQFKI